MIQAVDYVQFGGTRIDYQVVSSSRRRTVAIRVGPEEGVEVVVPDGLQRERVAQIVRKRAPWIMEKLRRVDEQVAPPPRDFVTGESFHYAGRRYRLHVRRSPRARRASLTFDQGRFIAVVPCATRDADLPRLLRPAFVTWYRERAELRLPARVAHFARLMGVAPERTVVKDQARRWGSCTKTGVLGLNWRIVMARASIVDYVVVHELAHLVEPDHGPRFWRVVASVTPDYEERREWLRVHGAQLTL